MPIIVSEAAYLFTLPLCVIMFYLRGSAICSYLLGEINQAIIQALGSLLLLLATLILFSHEGFLLGIGVLHFCLSTVCLTVQTHYRHEPDRDAVAETRRPDINARAFIRILATFVRGFLWTLYGLYLDSFNYAWGPFIIIGMITPLVTEVLPSRVMYLEKIRHREAVFGGMVGLAYAMAEWMTHV